MKKKTIIRMKQEEGKLYAPERRNWRRFTPRWRTMYKEWCILCRVPLHRILNLNNY